MIAVSELVLDQDAALVGVHGKDFEAERAGRRLPPGASELDAAGRGEADPIRGAQDRTRLGVPRSEAGVWWRPVF